MTTLGERDWTTDNQAYLAAMLDRVRLALEQHLQRPPSEARPEPEDRRGRCASR